ncbi:hypothetical protein YC2023_099833 [Brassica napus]
MTRQTLPLNKYSSVEMFHLLCKESTIFQSSFPILRVGDVKMLWLHRCFRFWDACNLKKKGDLIRFDLTRRFQSQHIGLTISRIYSGRVDCMSLVISMFLEATTTSSFSMYMFVLDSPKIPTLSRYGDAGRHFISEFQPMSTMFYQIFLVSLLVQR